MTWLWGRNDMQSREEHHIHRDLGALNDPVLLFGGPYSNVQATKALFAEAKAMRIPPQRMICTGDVVAYCAAPLETMDLICSSGVAVVAGNCEKMLGQGAADCGCGFEEGSACDVLSAGWFGFAGAKMRPQDRDWMRRCPDIFSFQHFGKRYAVIHGGVSDIARFIWPTSAPEVFDSEWAFIETAIGPVDVVIAGHCGIPFARQTMNGLWINAGVIGMPAHDGSTSTRFAVLNEGTVRFQHLAYDHEAAQADMVAAGLSQGYHRSLKSGYWPSEEVLPPDLRLPSFASG